MKNNKKLNNEYQEGELVEHPSYGKVRMFEYTPTVSLVKLLNEDLKSWSIVRVQTKVLKGLK